MFPPASFADPEMPKPHGPESFPTTRWSMIRKAGTEEGYDASKALADLCREYWQPLYAFVRRNGHSQHDAQDITQSFIVELIRGPLLERADPLRGRFRSFVITALKHFLLNSRRHEQAQRRGGSSETVPLDTLGKEDGLEIEGFRDLSPEDHFQRSWALTTLDYVLADLRAEYEKAGRQELFAALHPYLAGKQNQSSYAEVGRGLGLSENTVAVSIHRMRRRYGELLRERIASTVSSVQEVDQEIADLMAALSRSPGK